MISFCGASFISSAMTAKTNATKPTSIFPATSLMTALPGMQQLEQRENQNNCHHRDHEIERLLLCGGVYFRFFKLDIFADVAVCRQCKTENRNEDQREQDCQTEHFQAGHERTMASSSGAASIGAVHQTTEDNAKRSRREITARQCARS